jgi:hypothetical protein
MDIFLLPIILSIQAAILILLLLPVIVSVHTVKCTVNFSVGILYESLQWTRLLSWLALSSWLGSYLWSFIQVFLINPITIYTFFQGVFDFGPKSCRRSFFNILCNPVPVIEFEEKYFMRHMILRLFNVSNSIIILLLVNLQETKG